MTDQEAFDKMVNHLATLKVRSVNEQGRCIYNGSKCAVGALLTDYELHKFGHVDGNVTDLLELMEDCGHDTPLYRVDRSILRRMQIEHDDLTNWGAGGFDAWDQVESVANSSGVKFNDPRKVQNDG